MKEGVLLENKDVVYTDVEELTSDVMETVASDKTVGVVCHYELATEILKDLMRYENIIINNIEINNPEWDGYEDEYLVSVDNGELFCKKMKHDDRYILYIADVAFVHQDCNSALLAKNDVKEASIKFFEYEWELEDDEDFDCDGNREDCELDEDVDTEEETNITTSGEDVTISKTKDGKIAGFSKTWHDSDEYGNSYYSSYSHYSNDEDGLKEIMKRFGIL